MSMFFLKDGDECECPKERRVLTVIGDQLCTLCKKIHKKPAEELPPIGGFHGE